MTIITLKGHLNCTDFCQGKWQPPPFFRPRLYLFIELLINATDGRLVVFNSTNIVRRGWHICYPIWIGLRNVAKTSSISNLDQTPIAYRAALNKYIFFCRARSRDYNGEYHQHARTCTLAAETLLLYGEWTQILDQAERAVNNLDILRERKRLSGIFG